MGQRLSRAPPAAPACLNPPAQVFLMSLVCNVDPRAELLTFGHAAAPRQQLLPHPPGVGAPVAEDVLVAHPLAQQEVRKGPLLAVRRGALQAVRWRRGPPAPSPCPLHRPQPGCAAPRPRDRSGATVRPVADACAWQLALTGLWAGRPGSRWPMRPAGSLLQGAGQAGAAALLPRSIKVSWIYLRQQALPRCGGCRAARQACCSLPAGPAACCQARRK
jgi:hypothetical protein